MNITEISGYLRQFRQNLQYNIARAIIIRCMVFFTLYVILKIFLVATNIDGRTKSEQSFLKRIGTTFVESQKFQIFTVLNFLDSSRKIVESGYEFSAVSSDCEGAFFDCSKSSASNFTIFNTLYMKINSNVKYLTFNDPNSLFFYDISKNVAFMNQTTLGLSQEPFNTTLVNSFIELNPTQLSTSTSYQKYIFSESVINETSLCWFFCEHLGTMNATLCVTLTSRKIGQVSEEIKNYFYVGSSFQDVSTGMQIQTFNDWITISSYQYSLSNSIISCLSNQPPLLSKFINPEAGFSSICTENQILFGLLGSCLPYAYFQIKFNSIVQTQRYKQTVQQPQQTLSYFFSSNATYHQQIYQFITAEVNQIRHTGYSLILTMSLCLLVISIVIQAFENNLINSILQIKNLCEHLRNKEQKQFYSIRQKPQLFTFITDYFNKFMWIYKLLKSKSKSKHKKLLLEGIDLFSQDYTSVQEYILMQLIAIENILIQKYLKIRQLPIKKKGTARGTFRLALPENMLQRDPQKLKSNSKRRNANMRLLDPDDDEFMKNISIGFRGNRGVRFSNDIQTIQIDQGPILRKAKFSQISAQSCETIKNDLSEPDFSIKPTENKDSIKSLKEDDESYTSLNEINRSKKKDNSLRSRGLESIHFDLNNMRLDEELSEDEEEGLKEATEEEEMFQLGLIAITEETVLSYQRIIGFYEDLIKLKTKDIETITSEDLLSQKICHLYELTLQKYLKIGQLFTFQNEQNIEKQEEQRQKISEFEDLFNLQQSYMPFIKHQLLQKAEIVRLLIHQTLKLPVPFKNLQYLAKSQEKDIRIPARYLLATMAEQLTPHLDEVLFNNICLILQNQKTNCTLKRKVLAELTRTLQRYYSLFSQEISELKLVRQFYNTKNKKIYFLASLSNPKPFSKLLGKFYDFIHPFDMISVFNLDEQMPESIEQEISDTYLINGKSKPKRNVVDRVKFLIDLEDFNQMLNFTDKIRDTSQNYEKITTNSSKTISKKRVYEREFHQILNSIENDSTEFSKYIVVLLGEEHGSYTGEPEDSSSSGSRRPYQQKIHLQITKFIDRGYHHFIMAGQQLSLYPSRYGRLKKYIKLAPRLLELDLSDRDQQENYHQLQKYLM